MKDRMLAMGVAFLVIIDVVILTTYSIVEGIRDQLASKRVPNKENTEDIIGVSIFTVHFTHIGASKNN